jgi:hypothetical protein
MNVFRKIHDIVFPKRYPSAWVSQEMDQETRRQKNRDEILKGEIRRLANYRRTMPIA